jgi:hypothetical protein
MYLNLASKKRLMSFLGDGVSGFEDLLLYVNLFSVLVVQFVLFSTLR